MSTTGGDSNESAVYPAEGVLADLRRSSIRAKAAEQNYRDELLVRDRLIVQAVDQGHPLDRIASAALMTSGRVTQVLANHG